MDLLSVIGYILAIGAGLLILVALVVIHELGHAVVAKRNGVEVEEFGIGFPPRAWSKTLKNGVLFTLNWLPLGGFVRLKGEHDSDTQSGGYGAASLWVKTKILLAGVFLNWLTAVLIFTILAVTGLPKILPDQVGGEGLKQPIIASKIDENSPAQKIGIRSGDQITHFAGQELETVGELPVLTKQHAGQSVPVTYQRGGISEQAQVKLNPPSSEGGYFGMSITPQPLPLIKAGFAAPIVAVQTTWQITKLTFEGIGDAIANLGKGIASKFSGDQAAKDAGSASLGQASQAVTGPVGIIGQILPNAVQTGGSLLLFFIGYISLALAIMNVLPIPALDGGRLYTTLLFRALKKPLTKEREETIQAAGFLFLMSLVVIITIVDVKRIF